MDMVAITVMVTIAGMVVLMSTINRMSAPNHNRSLGKAGEFERLLAQVLSQAGWRVDQQPKFADSQPDLVARRGGKRYIFELKASSEGRKDRAIPLISQAILEVQLAAQRFPGAAIPVAVIAADHISSSVAEQVKRFALQNAPGVGIGIIDADGFRSFAGHGLESLNAERPAPPRIDLLAKRPSAANLFSDLNQWMLKILLSEEIPDSMLSAPRGRYGNASQLAAAARVSVMSAFRFVRQLSEERLRYVDLLLVAPLDDRPVRLGWLSLCRGQTGVGCESRELPGPESLGAYEAEPFRTSQRHSVHPRHFRNVRCLSCRFARRMDQENQVKAPY